MLHSEVLLFVVLGVYCEAPKVLYVEDGKRGKIRVRVKNDVSADDPLIQARNE